MSVKVLNLRHHEVRRTRQHKALQGLPVMARGVFSAVFDKGDTVLKLTTDPITYALLSDPVLSRDPHFPKVHKRHGIVGKQGNVFLYLLEMEKLRSISCYKRESRLLEPLLHNYENTTAMHKVFHEGRNWTAEDDALWLVREAEAGIYDKGFSRALIKLADFVQNFEAVLDLHWGNIMVRPGRKRSVVFSDPVFNAELYDKFSINSQ